MILLYKANVIEQEWDQIYSQSGIIFLLDDYFLSSIIKFQSSLYTAK